MARKQLYVTSPFKYNTRMMQAGEPVEMSGPHQRLYLALGKVSHEKPKGAKPVAAEEVDEAPKAPAKKAAPRKRTAKKAAAKK